MSRQDDYLWAGRGGDAPTDKPTDKPAGKPAGSPAGNPARNDVQQLEQLLSGLAHDGRELPLDELPEQQPATRRWPWLLAAAAAAVITAYACWPDDRLHVGAPERTFVASAEPLMVPLGALAEVTLQPGSELRFQHWRDDEALFQLERGEMSVRVAPPPAVAPDFFLVDTRLGRVTDKGCKYTLRITSDGGNVVRVTEGAVTFTFPERTVFVPAGAVTNVTPGGPSTPLFDDASPALRRTVQLFDAMSLENAGQIREKGLFAITEACQTPRDSLVLWHLLYDDDVLLRERAEAALIELVGYPEEPIMKGQVSWDPEVWLAYLRIGPWMQAQ